MNKISTTVTVSLIALLSGFIGGFSLALITRNKQSNSNNTIKNYGGTVNLSPLPNCPHFLSDPPVYEAEEKNTEIYKNRNIFGMHRRKK